MKFYLVSGSFKVRNDEGNFLSIDPQSLYAAGKPKKNSSGLQPTVIRNEQPVYKNYKDAVLYAKFAATTLVNNSKGTYAFAVFEIEANGGTEGSVDLQLERILPAMFIDPHSYTLLNGSLEHVNKKFKKIDLSKKPTECAKGAKKERANPKSRSEARKTKPAMATTLQYAGIGAGISATFLVVLTFSVNFFTMSSVLLLGAAAGIYLSGISFSGFAESIYTAILPTEKQKYKNNLNAEQEAIYKLADKLDVKNKEDEKFWFELDSLIQGTPKAKFSKTGTLEKKQPEFNKLHVLQFIYSRLENVVNIKNPKERALAEEKVLAKVERKFFR